MATKRKCACTLQKKVQGKGRGGEKRGDVGDGEEPKKWRKRLSQSLASREREGTSKKIDTKTDGRNRLIKKKKKDGHKDRRTEQVDKKKSAVPWPYNIQRTYHIQLAYAFNLLCGFSDDILCFYF
jgi:hypothetical protein